MIEIKEKKNCTGCRSCEQKCPKAAIIMNEDCEGFIYPVVNKKLCIDCNLCNNACPVENENINKEILKDTLTYAAWNNNEEERKSGSSGGSFAAICEYIFSLDGIVCGVGFDKKLNVVHKFASNMQQLKELKGSKYTQSNTNNTYKITKQYLDNNRIVLYTGTPCQISGLRFYLGKEYENLYTLDLVCHGVPSPKVYRKYLIENEKQYKSKVKKVYFRDKTTGWKKFSMKIYFQDSKPYINSLNKDIFMQGFLKNVYLRPSCYDCKFSKLPRYSDITLGDFWGVKNKYPDLDDDKGTSLLLVNTKKGKQLLEKCKDKLFVKECDLEYAIKYNPCITGSVKPDKNRDRFFKDLDNMSFGKLSKKYFPPTTFIKKVYYKIRLILSKIKKITIEDFKETYENQ